MSHKSFLLQELRKSILPTNSKKIRVGFVIDVFPAPYSLVMASTRLRAYDVILYFSKHPQFFVELYKPWHTYDIVIFQKAFQKEDRVLAKKLKRKGVTIVLDLNINVFDHDAISPYSQENYSREVSHFTESVSHILVSSIHLFKRAKETCSRIPTTLIEEHIPNKFFNVRKNIDSTPKVLVYSGYAVKANELYLIQDVLKELRKKYTFSILLLCEKDPTIRIGAIPCIFKKYQQSKIQKQLLQGDILLAPRDLSKKYNLGHSFSKIGSPMAVGLPVIASPVPSYKKSPALICSTDREWRKNLKLLITSREERMNRSKSGIHYCRTHYSTDSIMRQYEKLFTSLQKHSIDIAPAKQNLPFLLY